MALLILTLIIVTCNCHNKYTFFYEDSQEIIQILFL